MCVSSQGTTAPSAAAQAAAAAGSSAKSLPGRDTKMCHLDQPTTTCCVRANRTKLHLLPRLCPRRILYIYFSSDRELIFCRVECTYGKNNKLYSIIDIVYSKDHNCYLGIEGASVQNAFDDQLRF